MRLRNLILLNISLILLFVLCQFAFGALVQGSVTLTKDSGTGFNFTSGLTSATSYDITIVSSSGVSGCSGAYDLAVSAASGYVRYWP